MHIVCICSRVCLFMYTVYILNVLYSLHSCDFPSLIIIIRESVMFRSKLKFNLKSRFDIQPKILYITIIREYESNAVGNKRTIVE